MKKNSTLLWFIVFVFGVATNAQVSTTFLDTNNLSATINSNGFLFNDLLNQAPGLEVPQGTGIHTVYTASLWMAGRDQLNGQLHAAAQRYLPDADYAAGPVATTYDSVSRLPYKRLWNITQAQINEHIASYGKAGYVMPEVIENWPAHGDVTVGESAQLAPFYDANENDIYEPALGDYPCIRGDQSVYSIINDDERLHTASLGDPLGAEVHLETYAFNTIDEVNNVVFLNVTIHNRSARSYTEFYTGLWVDFDLGCAMDDRIGCDTSRNMFYVYNGDAFDESCIGGLGYGANTPAFGVAYMDQELNSFIAHDNGTGNAGDPAQAAHYYNYLQALWKDGSPLTYGGTGTGAGTATRYMYSGEHDATSQWIDTVNFPGDRKGIGAIGPFNLPAGESISFTMAMGFAMNLSTPPPHASITTLKSVMDKAKDYYDKLPAFCQVPPTGVTRPEASSDIQVFPNPASDYVTIRTTEKVTNIRLLDNLGRVVLEVDQPQFPLSVKELPNGVYYLQLEKNSGPAVQRVVVHHP